MSRVVQIELTLNIELEAHFAQHKDRHLGQGDWYLDEIVSMKVVDEVGNEFDLATSSFLARYLEDERTNELINLFAQQGP